MLIKPQGSKYATASDTFQSLQLTDAGVSQGKQKIFANVNLKIDSGKKFYCKLHQVGGNQLY
ncbi:hypothetical protein DKL58_08505 [Lactobacillus kullabergensis]|uniref:Uncharacterized protein n=1 Tax=Lactobacillus kullabergensis TaxID=1218493 RepID=A0ABN5LJZ3_9LACO|nr:hypothetical protein DKL58_08505 [Lactobacillus kullabergensis]